MPRSRSWSLESMTRSTSAWWSSKTPVARSMASTRVVLPWSTWATSATLRSWAWRGTRGLLSVAVHGRVDGSASGGGCRCVSERALGRSGAAQAIRLARASSSSFSSRRHHDA